MDGFIPLVPYDSLSEYNFLLDELMRKYQAVVQECVTDRCCVVSWSSSQGGMSVGVRERLLSEGLALFLRLTKGCGIEWCRMMNTMVVHSLGVAVRVHVWAHSRLGCRLSNRGEDVAFLRYLLSYHLECAIAEPNMTFNNMYEFENRNFMDTRGAATKSHVRRYSGAGMWYAQTDEMASDWNIGDDDERRMSVITAICEHSGEANNNWGRVPVIKVFEARLAVAMGLHHRLGAGSPLSCLSQDHLLCLFSRECF